VICCAALSCGLESLGFVSFADVCPLYLVTCRKHNVPYHIKSFVDANIHVYHALKRAADQSRSIDPDVVFQQSMLWEAMNARG